MVPDIAPVVHPLVSPRQEAAQIRSRGRLRHHHQIILLLQWYECLAAQGMALDHADRDRYRPGLADENADQRFAFPPHVDLREIMKALRHALVDGEMVDAVRLDDVAE